MVKIPLSTIGMCAALSIGPAAVAGEPVSEARVNASKGSVLRDVLLGPIPSLVKAVTPKQQPVTTTLSPPPMPTRPPAPAPYSYSPPPPPLPAYKVMASEDGEAIYLVGEINPGIAQATRAVMDKSPQAKALIISSPGGIVFEGAVIAELVRSRKMTVLVEDVCMSACTQILAAGADRVVMSNAQIGFHRAHTSNPYSFASPSMSMARSALGDATFRNAYKNAGLAPAFVTKALAVPAATMWFPPADQLLASKVITRIGTENPWHEPAAFGVTHASIVAQLMATPFWQAANKVDPFMTQRAIGGVWQKAVLGVDKTANSTLGMRYIVRDFEEIAPTLPDAALLDYVRLTMTTASPHNKPCYQSSLLAFVPPTSPQPTLNSEQLILNILAAKSRQTAMADTDAIDLALDFLVRSAANGQITKYEGGLFSANICSYSDQTLVAVDKLPEADRARMLRALITAAPAIDRSQRELALK